LKEFNASIAVPSTGTANIYRQPTARYHYRCSLVSRLEMERSVIPRCVPRFSINLPRSSKIFIAREIQRGGERNRNIKKL